VIKTGEGRHHPSRMTFRRLIQIQKPSWRRNCTCTAFCTVQYSTVQCTAFIEPYGTINNSVLMFKALSTSNNYNAVLIRVLYK
jgi:hypothetical protein